MRLIKTIMQNVKILEPQTFEDERGCFYESYNQNSFNKIIGKKISFVQDNHSISKIGVLRGLHFQTSPFAQAKLVRVVKGKIFDVAVDIRRSSPTFGEWFGITISSENKKMIWIPEGFAHGFLALSETVEVNYKTSDYYQPNHEKTIRWDDPSIKINWPLKLLPIQSTKDFKAQSFKELLKQGVF